MSRKHQVRKQLSIKGNARAHVGLSWGSLGSVMKHKALGMILRIFYLILKAVGKPPKYFKQRNHMTRCVF